MAMAVKTFPTQIASRGMEVVDLELKVGMKLPPGEIVWATLHPEQWSEVVRSGDTVRLGGCGAEPEEISSPLPLVRFKYENWTQQWGYLTTVLPRTYEVSSVTRKRGRIGLII